MTRQSFRLLMASSLAFVAMAWAAPAFAQNGTMTGRVLDSDRRTTDRDNKPIAGKQSTVDFQLGLNEATVTLDFKGEPAKQFQIITDAYGEWYKSGLPPGTYDISVRREWRDPVPGRVPGNKPVIFLAKKEGVVLKPGEKLKVPDMGALVEEKFKAGVKPPVVSNLSSAEAEAANKKAAELEAMLKDANAAQAAGKHEDAVRMFSEFAKKQEEKGDACGACYLKIGESQLKLKDEAKAEAAFLKAIEVNPKLADSYQQLAALYNGQKKFTEAAAMSKKASEFASGSAAGGDATTSFNQGVILWNAGDAEAARAEFLKAVQLDPKHAKAQYHLGLTTFSLAATGKVKMIDAKAPLEAYLKLDPTGEFADVAKALLTQIK